MTYLKIAHVHIWQSTSSNTCIVVESVQNLCLLCGWQNSVLSCQKVSKSNIVLNIKDIRFYYDIPLFNPLNAELNPICSLLALFGAHHILHVSRIRVKYGWLLRNRNLPKSNVSASDVMYLNPSTQAQDYILKDLSLLDLSYYYSYHISSFICLYLTSI
jgi:hypothetical protein